VLFEAEQISPADIPLLFERIAIISRSVYWIFDYGKNDDLASLIRKEAIHSHVEAKMFGGTHTRSIFYSVADVVVAPPLPLLVREVLAAGTPLLVLPSPSEFGQKDSLFLSELGVAQLLPNLKEINPFLRKMLSSSKISEMKKVIQGEFFVEDDAVIASIALRLAENKELVLQNDRFLLEEELVLQKEILKKSLHDRSQKVETLSSCEEKGFFEDIGPKRQEYYTSASWKEAYAGIVLQEKKFHESFEKLDNLIHQWKDREFLAQKYKNIDLQDQAQIKAEDYMLQRKELREAWQELQKEKEELRSNRPSESIEKKEESDFLRGEASFELFLTEEKKTSEKKEFDHGYSLDRHFQKLEVEDELNQLKERMKINSSQIDLSRLKGEE